MDKQPLSSEEQHVLRERFLLLSTGMDPQPTGVDPRLDPISGIRFVIFDFYGTLFISGVGDIGIEEETGGRVPFQLALAACGTTAGPATAVKGIKLFKESVKKHRERLRNEGIEEPEPPIAEIWMEVLKHLCRQGRITLEPTPRLARRFAVEFEARINPVWPMPGLHRLFYELTDKEVELGIISNSQFYTPLAFEALTKASLSGLGFNEHLLHWSYLEKCKKPSTLFYERFLDKLEHAFPDADPGQVLYLGNDMLKDIWPASQVGMKTGLFAGDARSLRWRRDDERCRYLSPDLVITHWDQLPDLLE